jgi:hypothetical protein
MGHGSEPWRPVRNSERSCQLVAAMPNAKNATGLAPEPLDALTLLRPPPEYAAQRGPGLFHPCRERGKVRHMASARDDAEQAFARAVRSETVADAESEDL